MEPDRRLGLSSRPARFAGAWILVATERHAAVAAQVFGEFPSLAGNLLHDTHTAVLMREHGVARICTRDADFRRFPFLEVVEPL